MRDKFNETIRWLSLLIAVILGLGGFASSVISASKSAQSQAEKLSEILNTLNSMSGNPKTMVNSE